MNAINSEVQVEVNEMKKVFTTLGLAIVFNVAVSAQNNQKKQAAPVNARSSQSVNSQSDGNITAGSGNAALSTVTSLQGELQNTLDVKNAKVGDQVVLKTTQAVKQAGQVVIPKGTQLIGRVTEVQQRAKNGAASKLGLVFDRLQNRDLSIPIVASIVSITNVRSAANLGDGLDSDLSGSNMTSTRTTSGGGGSTGGGLLGGVTNTVGGVVNTATNTVGSVTGTATNTLGSTTQTVGRTVNDIQLSTSASGSAQSSTTLSSPNNNIRLEKGVTFGLNVQRSGGN
jgi:hypothetical protein